MDIELAKRMMDACYQGKRIRDMLPALPEGVSSSFIQYLDVIETLERQGIQVKVSDVSDTLALPRPGVTRTIKDMESKGYVKKLSSSEDRRVTYLTATDAGKALSEKYNTQYFTALSSFMDDLPEEDIRCTIRTMEKFYKIMCERRINLDK
ncbi:MarR family winged helix-turn-helix transcriptional regulator [Blautia sp. Sow4_E7]|uniref:MarR family winged helix-turn-helix transcriptional regulator n=1 Tax=Blautia sp. Sow4_E7 TaxID=3438749 RepID=UPI003F9227BD